MHVVSGSEVIVFIREWELLKSQGKALHDILDLEVLSDVLEGTDGLRQKLLATSEIDRHGGEYKWLGELDTVAQIIETGNLFNLQVLDLSHDYNDKQGEVGVQQAKTLAAALKSGNVPLLNTLNLWGNPLGEPGVTAVACAVESGAVPALKMLGIGARRIQDDMHEEGSTESLESIARAFASGHAANLRQLALYRIVSGDDEMKVIMRALRLGRVTGLRTLHLQGSEFVSKLGSGGLQAIADSHFFSSLVELSLAGHNIGDEGVGTLLKAFKSHRMRDLQILDLDRNTMTDETLVEFVKLLEAPRHLPSLQFVRLGPTCLTPTSAKAIATAYRRNRYLMVEISFLDWPSSSLRKTAAKLRNRNQKAANSFKDSHMRKINLQTNHDSTTPCLFRCFHRELQGKLPLRRSLGSTDSFVAVRSTALRRIDAS